MAQAWESDAIKAAGDDWAAAKKAYDSATTKAEKDAAQSKMNEAANRANQLRSDAGYSLDGTKADSTPSYSNTGSSGSSSSSGKTSSSGSSSSSGKTSSSGSSSSSNSTGGAKTPTSPTTSTSAIPEGAVARTVYKADGTPVSGYVLNGTSYYSNGTPIQNGDYYIDVNGIKWVKGDAAQNAEAAAQLEAKRNGSSTGSAQTQPTQPTQPTQTQTSGIPAGAVEREIVTAAGQSVKGYVLNGHTYYMDGMPIQNGDSVVDVNGIKWVKGDDAQNALAAAQLAEQRKAAEDLERTRKEYEALLAELEAQRQAELDAAQNQYLAGYEDLRNQLTLENQQQIGALESQYAANYESLLNQLQRENQAQIDLIEQQYGNQIALLQNQIKNYTDTAIAEQQALIPQYEQQAMAQRRAAELAALKDQYNLAMGSAAKGDAGGIGQKQYSDSQATYEQALYDINLQLANLKAEVAQNVEQLNAQGKFEAAQAAMQVGAEKIRALLNQRDSYMKYSIQINEAAMDQQRRDAATAMNNALTRLELGILTADDIRVLGIPADQAQRLADMLSLQSQISIEEAKKTLKGLQQTAVAKVETQNPPKQTGGDDGGGNTYVPTVSAAAKSTALRNALLNDFRGAGTLDIDTVLSRIEQAQQAGMTDEDAYALIATLFGDKVAKGIYSNLWVQTK